MMKYDHEHKASHSPNFQMRGQEISRRGVHTIGVKLQGETEQIILRQVNGVEAVGRWIQPGLALNLIYFCERL